MKTERVLSQDEFDRLLRWLSPDRERAGERYEQIRQGLIKIFNYRGCASAEDLADETINRVAQRLKDILDTYQGPPDPYFYGVAKKVYLEYTRLKPPPATLPAPGDDPEEMAGRYECLDECMSQLPAEGRELIMLYYRGEKQAKIDARKELGERLNLNNNALRARAHRIRERLEKCVRECLARKAAGT
jgi:RNA polymerase sigma factor (sigma-70 family)